MDDFLKTLSAAKQGKDDAVLELVSHFGEEVRHACRQVQLDHVYLSFSDLWQDAWVRIWAQLEKFEIQSDSDNPEIQFRIWLRRVARHEIFRVLEKQQAQRRNPPPFAHRVIVDENLLDVTESPSHFVDRMIEKEKLHRAIERLPDEGQRIIRGCFFEGLSIKELSECFDMSYNETRRKMMIALADLKREMESDRSERSD